MRKYLFRGKPTKEVLNNFIGEDLELSNIIKDGWVYGSLIWQDDTPWIVSKVAYWDDNEVGFEWWLPVIPETVGRYAGTVFATGEQLFEGDIASFIIDDKDNEVFGSIVWADDKHKFLFKSQTGIFWEIEDIQPSIIGNIHDDSELLGERL